MVGEDKDQSRVEAGHGVVVLWKTKEYNNRY